ncbi:MAG: hydantoinase/oxoprolinase family protein [Nitrososphaerales archaeon]
MIEYRLGFDIGGTFTDLIAIREDTGEMTVVKCPTTPADPSDGVINGLNSLFEKLDISGANLNIAVHSTTLVTNTVIEQKGAKTALVTTKGFRDILEIGREKRITVYDISEEKLEPLVPRRLRMEVEERILHDGQVSKKLSIDQVRRVAQQLKTGSVESIAVSLLHSYANPIHEREVRRIISKIAPKIMISISSEILPEWREYERTSATVINAYAQPRTANYMNVIEKALREQGFAKRLFIMQSSGGLSTVEAASKFPVRIIESGPAAGALAATYIGSLANSENMISFDMGGTTAKCCLISGGEPRVTSDFEVAGYMYLKGSGYPVRVPTIDLLEIGAGGGSIAHVDYGLLKVGPTSAGADPGPACYPNGGTEPTVTDADLVLGFLNPEYFLGGTIKLDKSKSIKIIEEKIASKLGLSVEEAASGIYDVVNANMSRAMRIISVERGQDPAQLSMIAFGGAGPVHATRLAQLLKIRHTIVPLAAGATSALGLLVADMKFDFVRTHLVRLDEIEIETIKELYASMKELADGLLSESQYQRRYIRLVDVRFAGQAFELPVPFGEGFDNFDIGGLKASFLKLYSARYGYTSSDPIECVNWKLVAVGIVPKVSLEKKSGHGKSGTQHATKGTRVVQLPDADELVEATIYDRYRLTEGDSFFGPAIVEEKESTCVVLPGQRVTIDHYANLIIES